MSVSFYSDDSSSINRKVSISFSHEQNETMPIDEVYELEKCIQWIKCSGFSKVALQFSDDLLSDSTLVDLKIKESTNKQTFVIPEDTPYDSCCVNEHAAKCSSSDAIIHFGHACLSHNTQLPVLYIFGKGRIDTQDATSFFKKLFPDNQSLIILLYEVVYYHAIGDLVKNLKDYQNLATSKVLIPSKDNESSLTGDVNDNVHTIIKCHRQFTIPKSHCLNDYNIFYIGTRNQTLMNFMFSLNHCKFYTYNPVKKCAQPETLDINRFLKKRYYYIEKAKDAKLIGILVSNVGSNYLTIIKHLKELIKEAGKKYCTLVLGKLNPAKLANFPAVEIFINVACPESSVIDNHEFYQPIITPYELEISLNQSREWTGDYVTDFSELLPGAAKHIPPSQIKHFDEDVSLITGKLRISNFGVSEKNNSSVETSALVKRDEMKLSTIHSQAAGQYLSQCSWKGLEQCLGETPVTKIQQGRKGIACKYENEEVKNG